MLTATRRLTAPSTLNPHKAWLFWNSTRNGTADVYYETINPLFAAAAVGTTSGPIPAR